jgi:hypothetical protein
MLSRGSFEPRVIGLWRFSLVGRSLSLDLALPRLDLSFHARTAMACKGQPRLSSDHRGAGLSPKLNASFGHQICTTRNVLSMTRDDCARLRRKSFLSDEMGRRRCCPALAINAIALHIRLCRFFCKFSIMVEDFGGAPGWWELECGVVVCGGSVAQRTTRMLHWR